MLHPTQKQLIRSTFEQIVPIAPVAATLFYSRLFEIAPELRALFRYSLGTTGMIRQGTKLMEMLAVATEHLDDLELLVSILEDLAQRHVAYGVEPEYYDAVGAALLWTLEQGLGNDFTAEVKAAWTALYSLIADTMKQAAYA